MLKKTLIDNRDTCRDLLELYDMLESLIDKIQNDKINRRSKRINYMVHIIPSAYLFLPVYSV